MPIGEHNVKQAENLISALQRKLENQRSEFGDMGPPSPEMARTQSNLDRLRAEVNEYQKSIRKVDESGKLTQNAATSGAPNEIGSDKDYTLFYEPSLEQVKQSLSNPDLVQRLNLGSWIHPDAIDSIDENSSAYQTVADDMYKQAAQDAELRGKGLKRYKNVSFTDSPLDYIVGGFNSLMPSVAGGLERGVTGGLGRVAFNAPIQSLPYELGSRASASSPSGEFTPETSQENLQAISKEEQRNPSLNTASQFAGSISPLNPGNLAARGVSNALNYAGRNVAGKAAAAGLSGIAGANVEGLSSDVLEASETGQGVDEILSNAYQQAPLRSVTGGGFGSSLDLVGQGAGALSRAAETPDLKLLREAGGDTDTIRGVVAPETIQENIRAHQRGRTGEVGFPGDIAAARVAPKIHESLQNQIRAERARIAEETEQYLSHPDIAGQEESLKPVAENLFSLFSKGALEGPVTGEPLHPNAEAVNTFKKLLNSIGQVKHVGPEETAAFAEANNGILLDKNSLKALGIQEQADKFPIYVPAKTNARALLEMEDMIDEKLKMAGTPGGINNPIWKSVNLAVKSIRDRFGAPRPEIVPPTVKSAQPEASVSVPSTIPAEPQPVSVRRESVPPPVTTSRPPTPETFNRQNPEGRWSAMAPEAQKSVDELEYNKNIEAQKREAKRMESFGEVNSEVPYLSKEELEREVQRRLGNSPNERRLPREQRGLRDNRLPDEINALVDAELVKRTGKPVEEIQNIRSTPTKPALGSESIVDDGSFVDELSMSEAPEIIPSPGLESQLDAQLLLRDIQDQAKIEADSMGKRSAANAYDANDIVPNQGNFDLNKVVKEVENYGGIDHAGRLNMGMREGSLENELSKYKGKKANDVAQNLEYPIEVSIDNGAMMLRDGRHRLEAAKRAGATHIKTRVRKYNQDGKAEEVGVVNLPIKTSPKQYEATLDDGTKVYGLSALRHQQHLAQQKLEDAASATGANSLKGVTARTLDFGSGPGQAAQDAALLEEAKRLGLEKELRETAGTAAYQRLAPLAWGLSGRGFFRSGIDALKLHADPSLRAMAGTPPNPFQPAPNTPGGRIAQYLFESMPKEALNLTQGLPGARYSPFAVDAYEDYQEKKKNEY